MIFDKINVLETEVELGDAKINLCRLINPPSDYKRMSHHSHFYYECHVLTEGSTLFTIEEKNIKLESSQMLIIPPITAHYPFSDNKTATDIVLVLKLENVCGERGFYRYFSSALASISKKPVSLDSSLMEKIIQFNSLSLNNSLRDLCYRKAVAYEIICLLFDTINGFCDTKIHENLNIDNKLFTLENLVNDSKCSISYISEALGYSPRHTSRVIKQIYGQSLKDVRFSNMTATAKRLMLLESDTPLANIAQRTGFSSLSAMNREFLKREGISPAEYRKMLLNKDYES